MTESGKEPPAAGNLDEHAWWSMIAAHQASVFFIPPEHLPRLAAFFAAHASIDVTLIALESYRREDAGESRDDAVHAASEGTFETHLKAVESMLASSSAEIARTFNRTRNGWLHWKPRAGRRLYRDLEVTSFTGGVRWSDDLSVFMNDPAIAGLLRRLASDAGG